MLQGQAPAPNPALGQPQPQPAPDDGYIGGDINMTLALTGVGNGALPPAAQQAIQNAVAQEVPGVS